MTKQNVVLICQLVDHLDDISVSQSVSRLVGGRCYYYLVHQLVDQLDEMSVSQSDEQ